MAIICPNHPAHLGQVTGPGRITFMRSKSPAGIRRPLSVNNAESADRPELNRGSKRLSCGLLSLRLDSVKHQLERTSG
jgi:hypothetical protein